MRICKFIILVLTISFVGLAIADEIPIEDLSQNAGQAPSALDQAQGAEQTQESVSTAENMAGQGSVAQPDSAEATPGQADMSVDQRVNQLEQQIQQLQGKLDEQTHEIQVLNEQLRNFYQGLDQRLNNMQTGKGNTQIVSNQNGIPTSPEDEAYKTAFNALSAKKYDDATKLMQQYLTDYPDGKYTANAHYWLGEIYYLQSDLTSSADEMQTVIKQFSQSPKVPDAMLKMAMIYNSQQKYDQARNELQEIKKQMQMIGQPPS
jgi:tol-pal system protein YbgF